MKDKILSWEESVLWLKNQPDQQELVRACFYDDPPVASAERFYRSSEWKAVQNLLRLQLRSERKVLDIGAGRGISSYSFARDEWSVTALEPAPSEIVGAGAIRQLHLQNLDIAIVQGRGEKLPFSDDSFDLIYGRAVLHHANNLPDFCSEVGRVLKPGGKFLFTREHVLSKRVDLQEFLDNHALHHLYQGEHAYLLTDYVDTISSCGLVIEKIFKPFSSDINLYPSSSEELIKGLQASFRFPVPKWFIKNITIKKMDRKDNTPGRLFSFLGSKI